MNIKIKNGKEIEIMKEGGKILAGIMQELEKNVRPKITTMELNKLAEELVFNSGAKPSFKGYQTYGEAKPYPAALCVSVNEQIVHAIPSNRSLKEGDIISLDLGIFYKGFHSDMATTLGVGKITKEAQNLIEITKEALDIAIKEARPKKFFGDIGFAIQNYVESRGFNVVRDLCGHGIGNNLHEDPEVLNFGERGAGPEIKKGMVFCIEPMVTVGSWKIKESKDGFGYETADGKLSCHFEHTIAAIKGGSEILTRI